MNNPEIGTVFFELEYGSHVYGTNRPDSDRDYRGLFFPRPRDIILQKVEEFPVMNLKTKASENAKNTKDDVDREYYTLKKFFQFCHEGQTLVLDMLFAPPKHWTQTHPIWNEIYENKHKLLTRKTTAYIKYSRDQAAKYGIKGSRLAAARAAMEFFGSKPREAKILDFQEEIDAQLIGEWIKYAPKRMKNQTKDLPHLVVCEKMVPMTAACKVAYSMSKAFFDEFGERAAMAEKNEGWDAKALMHAYRVGNEAMEVLTTGHVTFPRPNADVLLRIRNGGFHYKQVAEMVEEQLFEIELAAAKSSLPDQIDTEFCEELTNRWHTAHVVSETAKHTFDFLKTVLL